MEKLDLDLKSSELLDAVLQSFGDGDHLDQSTVMEIFGGKLNEAVRHINILAQLGYISKMGETEGSRLGMLFYKEEKADLIVAQGGFAQLYHAAAEEKRIADERQLLADENARLGNEVLKHQLTIRDQESRIRNLDEKLKQFEMLKNYEWLVRLGIAAIIAALTWWIRSEI